MTLDILELPTGITCVRLHGRLDAPGADAIDLRFTAAVVAPGRDAIIDLTDVNFIASMGLRLLIGAARGLRAKRASLALFGAQGLVSDVLKHASIDQIIPVVDTESAALARLAR